MRVTSRQTVRNIKHGGEMLCRIQQVNGIGLFHEASGAKRKLEQLTLVYAGNGRGKSTLAGLLASVAKNDGSALEERKTIDGTNDPAATLQFDSGHMVKFEKGQWSEARPEIRVFDTSFIDQNVHSGGQVSAEHRKNLLDFAIGDRAVTSRIAEEAAVRDRTEASQSIQTISNRIEAYAGKIALPVFRSLILDDDIDEQLSTLRKRLVEAQRIGSITALNVPSKLSTPNIDLDNLFEILHRTLENVHADATNRVDQHIAKLGNPNAAVWLNDGQEFDDGSTCPYCGQSIEDVSLIEMYKTHFDAAYRDLKELVSDEAKRVSSRLSQSVLEELQDQKGRINEQLAVWSEYVPLSKLEDGLDSLVEVSLNSLSDLLQELMSDKTAAPAEAVGTPAQFDEAKRLWSQFCSIYADHNAVIEQHITEINSFKSKLLSEDAVELAHQISLREHTKIRYSSDVQDLFAELGEAESALAAAEKAKQKARKDLTDAMSQTLSQYRLDINKYLLNLGASFEIDEIRTTYTGGKPRTDYGISLRGKSIKLSGGNPSFATALSEGDKRTLAFAFFVASTLTDPDISKNVLVIDDPVSSLDRSRRTYTMKLLGEMVEGCHQLILLAHDPNFLRETKSILTKENQGLKVSTLQLERVENSYTGFNAIDLDRECETPYFTNYRTVDEYVAGKQRDAMRAAIALRPLIEGYLHRKFPGKLPIDLTLGATLSFIDNELSPSPFDAVKKNIHELRELNSFAGKFHHDTNPGLQTEIADPGEVETFGRRALAAVHGA